MGLVEEHNSPPGLHGMTSWEERTEQQKVSVHFLGRKESLKMPVITYPTAGLQNPNTHALTPKLSPRAGGGTRAPGGNLQNGFLCFFCKQDFTYLSSSRKVVGFNVSKSISISSGLESLREGSRDWMMCTTLPSFSPGRRLMSKLSCRFSS